jgi:hypothetical protein
MFKSLLQDGRSLSRAARARLKGQPSVLGVAGGELLIPALVLIFGADIKTAGSASILISLGVASSGLWRYWRADAIR